jgi:hypothetical protein
LERNITWELKNILRIQVTNGNAANLIPMANEKVNEIQSVSQGATDDFSLFFPALN